MGRHEAAVGADVDPLVAAALARRGAAEPGARHARAGDERRGGPVGWPGREGDGPGDSPVGWPGSAAEEPLAAPTASPSAEPDPERERLRGWRRLFGGRAA